MPNRYIIIGNGVAGDSAAVKLRELDPSAVIHMFTKEAVPFYYRPRLIDYIAGSVDLNKITLHNLQWYENHNIQLHLAEKITSLDREKKELRTMRDRLYGYDRMLLACGSDSFIPPIEGFEGPGCFHLQTVGDADQIIEAAKCSRKVLVIGGGLLGLEAAHSISLLGCDVSVIDRNERLLSRQLDFEGSQLLEKLLVDKRLTFYKNEISNNITHTAGALNLHLQSAKTLHAEMILVSAGVRPHLELARRAGLAIGKGIVVNDFMETSINHIYAAGDVCEHAGNVYGIWLASKQQGETAAYNMAGIAKAYKGTLSSHKLKIAGINMLSVGNIEDTPSSVVFAPDVNSYRRAFISSGIIIGCILMGDMRGEREIVSAITNRSEYSTVEHFFQ